jgi:hypothetical protein
LKKNNWNAIYTTTPVTKAWEMKKIERMIDDTIHEQRPDIDEIRNPVDNDRRKLNNEKKY